MNDRIEKFKQNIIQHGKHNNRIYLMKFSWDGLPGYLDDIENLAIKNNYSKIFAKIPSNALPPFLQKNYEVEAYIPNYYKEGEDCLMVSKFYSNERAERPTEQLSGFFGLMSSAKTNKSLKYKQPSKYIIRSLIGNDVESITQVYKKVFKSYPFPIFDKNYILKSMEDKSVQYFGIFDNLGLIGISSAELDIINKNAEMTDFAILPEYRGQNMASLLLDTMQHKMSTLNIKTLYTIARLKSPGMNKTFLKSGYKYSGTLINNTNISGEIESMNVYYKHLP